MSETDTISTVDVPEGTNAVKDARPIGAKREVPDGFVTPIQFAKLLSEWEGKEVRPQIVYSYIRNSETFKQALGTDAAGRPVVNLDAGRAWFDAKAQRAQERAAKKAAEGDKPKATKKGKAAAAEASSAPVTEVE